MATLLEKITAHLNSADTNKAHVIREIPNASVLQAISSQIRSGIENNNVPASLLRAIGMNVTSDEDFVSESDILNALKDFESKFK
ncbi:hypothetical protein [Vibrio fluvialis]|uniref:hypothetical protein n=1 Tax=Vibrio fluvialis TaxID=676 RepID=UPI001BAFAC9C|nr:hypothetical protein [Vibrio fluvialis]QUF70042.1 hypothetical protein KC397_06520 [Vibrio fluvialis]